MEKYDLLKLENQLCFPLYAAAKEVVRLYTPHLAKLHLTYTQYIVMMLIWEKKAIAVKELAQRLFLDTGTLTPLLKKLEKKQLVQLEQDENDRRSVIVNATQTAMKLRDSAVGIPGEVGACLPLEMEEAVTLYKTLHKIINLICQNGRSDKK